MGKRLEYSVRHFFCCVLFLVDLLGSTDVCFDKTGCECIRNNGVVSLHCDLDVNMEFDFGTFNLENITHVTIKSHKTNMTPNDNVTHYPKIRTLHVENNQVSGNLSSNFLQQFPSLEKLNMKNCQLRFLDTGVFSILKNIQEIDLSENGNLGFQTLARGFADFQSPKLVYLNLSMVHLANELIENGEISYSLFASLRNTTLETLDISWNRIHTLRAPFTFIPNLRYLNFSGTSLSADFYCLATLNSLLKLEEFVLNYWPESTRGFDVPVYVRPPYKNKRSGSCLDHFIIPFNLDGSLKVLSTVKTLQFQNSDLETFYVDFFQPVNIGPNNFVNIYFTYCKVIRPINHIRGLVSLEVFDLSYPTFEGNELYSGVMNTTFVDMPALKVLLIPGIRLYLLKDVELEHLFSNVERLIVIDISSNNLSSIPDDMFRSNPSLSHLNLSRNLLESFTVNLSNFVNLTTLDLSFNRFLILDQAFISSEIFRQNDVSLYLEYNNFECDCNINELLAIKARNLSITCTTSEGVQIISTNSSMSTPPSFDCLEQGKEIANTLTIIIIVSCVFGSIVILVMSIFFCLYKRRKHIFCCVNIRQKQEPFVHVMTINNDRTEKRKPTFLAFIAYSHNDRDFVSILYPKLDAILRELMPEYNKEHLITLYDKHFLPGDELDIMCEQAILQSYVTIAIISDSFLNSRWCSYEVKTAFDINAPLIPLFITRCDPEKFEGVFRHMFNHKVRMEWPQDDNVEGYKDRIDQVVLRLGQAVCAYVKDICANDTKF